MPTISTLTVDVEARTSSFSKGLKVVGAGLAALTAGAALAFKEFEEAEKVSNQTAAVLESTGGAANVTAKQIESLAGAISRKTGIDDEAIQAGQNMLLTFTNIRNEVGKGNDIFNQATTTITDMSVALGQDMKSSAIQVGKALNDPVQGITALQRVGVAFTDKQKEMVAGWVEHGDTLRAQKFILQELTTEFGGSAEAQATASGKMQVAFGNLVETIGGLLAPVVTKLLEGITALAVFLTDNLGPALSSAWDQVKSGAGFLGDIVDWFKKVWDAVKPVAETIANELVEAFTQTWNVLKSNVGPMLQALWDLLKKVWDILEPVIKFVGLLVGAFLKLALEALPVVIAVITKVIEWLAKIIEGALDVVTFIRDKFVEPIVNFLGRIIDKIGDVIGWVKDKLVDAWQAIAGPIKAVLDRIIGWVQTVIDVVKGLIGFLEDAARMAQAAHEAQVEAGFGGGHGPGAVGNVPSGQHGGVVARTGLAVIHKGEAISGVNNELGFGGVTVNVTGWVGNDAELARKIRDELLKLGRRNATAGLV